MPTNLIGVDNPEVLEISINSPPANFMYICTGVAMIDYTWGHDGVGHEPLSFHIVDDGENPLRFNRGAVTGTATTASLNAISGSGHVTWAVDSVDSDQDEEFVTLTANLAVTGGGDVLHRMGYQVTILSTERRIT